MISFIFFLFSSPEKFIIFFIFFTLYIILFLLYSVSLDLFFSLVTKKALVHDVLVMSWIPLHMNMAVDTIVRAPFSTAHL